MEIPEFCTRASRRIQRKKKTEEETDPDYSPSTTTTPGGGAATPKVLGGDGGAVDPGKKKAWEARKEVRRSKALEVERNKPVPSLQFIERPEYTVENWRERAEGVRKRQDENLRGSGRKRRKMITGAAGENKKGRLGRDGGGKKKGEGGASNPPMEEPVEEPEEEDNNFDYSQLGPIAGDLDPYAQYLERRTIDAKNFDLKNLPKFVMGTGAGDEDGPPAFEYRSLWNYELLPLSSTDTLETVERSLPWKRRDPTTPHFTPDILSIVACFSVGRRLDLKTIAQSTRNIEYNPDRFAPLIMRIREPKTTALIFSSGRIIVTGGKSEMECRVAARKYARIIQRLGYKVKVLGYEIQNISAHCHLRFKVRLNHLALNKLYGPLSYEPELFPGLIIPLEYPRVKVVIFCTGSVLMTGAKSVEDLNKALKSIYALVRMYGH